jgi:2-polyprenyl-6-methoxyphenol hydroxylase-like FAD-dependent oxidoreductase
LKKSKIGQINPKQPLGTAIVIGGSLCGLASAAMLCRHAKKVILLEQVDIVEGMSVAPQSKAVHVLLHRSWKILDRILPGSGTHSFR